VLEGWLKALEADLPWWRRTYYNGLVGKLVIFLTPIVPVIPEEAELRQWWANLTRDDPATAAALQLGAIQELNRTSN
jgi:hypothetical protein